MGGKLSGLTLAILGGEKWQIYLLSGLIKEGARCRVIGLPKPLPFEVEVCKDIRETIAGADAIILPMPGLDEEGKIYAPLIQEALYLREEDLKTVKSGTPVITGVAGARLKKLCSSLGLPLVEIAEMDEVAIYNSIPSAEGAIQIAMEELPITIHGSKALVLGFGRFGMTLARMLSALGAQTMVASINPAELARAYEMGFTPVSFSELPARIGEADIIFNTIPALILDKGLLSFVAKDTFILDLASPPGGTDFATVRELGIKAMLAPGLPGKVAPRTAGEILARLLPDIILDSLTLEGSKDQKDLSFHGLTIGFALTGSHCTFHQVVKVIKWLVDLGATVIPIVSQAVASTDTRFGTAQGWLEEISAITGRKPIATIVDAEPIGPKSLLDILVVAPCTGNTLAKMANGITDSPVLMSIKAQLRNEKPVVLAISTNDGLGANAVNLGRVLNMKNVYLVPFGQDNPAQKSNSLVAHFDLIPETIQMALKGRQIQPVLLSYPGPGDG